MELKKQKRRSKRFLIVFMLTIAGLFSLFNFVAPVEATTPTINNSVGNTSATCTTTCALTSLTVTNTNDILLLMVLNIASTGTTPPTGSCPVSLNTVTSTSGYIWNQLLSHCYDGGAGGVGWPAYEVDIYWTQSTASGQPAQVITLTYGGTTVYHYTAWDVSNVLTSPQLSVNAGNTWTSSSALAPSLNTSLTFSGNAFIASMFVETSPSTCLGTGGTDGKCDDVTPPISSTSASGCTTQNCIIGASVYTAGTNYALYGSSGSMVAVAGNYCSAAGNAFANACLQVGQEAATSAAITSPNNAPFTLTPASKGWNIMNRVFGVVFSSSSGTGGTCGSSKVCPVDAFVLAESALQGIATGLIKQVTDTFHFAENVVGNAAQAITVFVSDSFHLFEILVSILRTLVVTITNSVATIYTTVTTLDVNSSSALSPSALVLMLVIFTPAGIIGVVSKSFWGVAIGALLGAGVAALPQVNLIPFWVLVPIVLGVITMFIARRGDV